ncbi:MAG TPA: radical SAM protein [Acidimicrobiales bacterium]|nr:radical SAM protein [Acidimicrobiales bacterium]
MRGSTEFRWRLADDDGGQAALFAEEELVQRHVGIGAYRGLEFLHVRAQRIITTVPEQSRVPFRHTINAYRGCSHACTYCFARPTHEYLGLGMGEDFERTLVVKINAVERVRAEVRNPGWSGELIAMGTNTDPYQRAEGKYHLTRGIIDVLAEAGNPFSILTKSTLILRDLDRLMAAAGRADVRCNFSIGTLDPEVWKATEPGTPHPRQRVEAVRRLNEAGIPTGVLIAPIIPGLSDATGQLEEVTAACLEAGAVSVSPLVLHLRPGVKEHFLADLRTKDPELADALTRRYRGAYLPQADQAEIAGPVTRTVVRLRPQSPPSRQWHPAAGHGDGRENRESRRGPVVSGSPVLDTPEPEQLRFAP